MLWSMCQHRQHYNLVQVQLTANTFILTEQNRLELEVDNEIDKNGKSSMCWYLNFNDKTRPRYIVAFASQ